MADNGLQGVYKKVEHSDSVPSSWPNSPHEPCVVNSDVVVASRPEIGHSDLGPKGRRRSLSDPLAKRRVNASTGIGKGLLRKLGNLLAISPASPRVYSSAKNYTLLPQKKLVRFHGDIVASYSGPYGGLANGSLILPPAASCDRRESLSERHDHREDVPSAGDANDHECPLINLEDSEWRLRNETAYGMSLSLYEYRNEDKTECTGDPIADVCAIRATCNSCIMGVADGVGWGQGARRASQCAMKGAMEYIWSTLYCNEENTKPLTTTSVFKCMRESLDKAQEMIIRRSGSMTTLCLAVVADIATDDAVRTKALCVVNVGDSLAFVYSHDRGVREVTVGCREYSLHRNIQFCDGALGPCMGEEPDLGNLTFSYTAVEEGDIVFLTTDGVSDNFDPVVAKRAVPSQDFKSNKSKAEIMFSEQREVHCRLSSEKMPVMTPRERQEEMTRMMGEVIRHTEVPNDNSFSASSLCSKLLQYTVNQTEGKRAAHEATNNIITICEKEQLENKKMMTGKEALYQHARGLPGKLDHATVVAYVAGGAIPQSPNIKDTHLAKDSANYIDVTVGHQQSRNMLSMVE